MDIKISNTSFVAVAIVDAFEYLMWVEKYNDESTFELCVRYSPELLAILHEDYYVNIPGSEKTMIIEDVEIKVHVERGPRIKVSGRSLESTIDRRIVLRQINIDTTLQAGIQALLNAEIISSIYPERNFLNFIFSTSVDPAVTGYNLKAQYYSENLLDVIKHLCKQTNLGFKVIQNSTNQFVFSLFAGKDRSYSQSTNAFVVFAPEFDNLLNSEYIYTKRFFKTYALVSGDPTSAGSGLPIRAQSFSGSVDDINMRRREMFVDARDMSKFLWDTNTQIADAVYALQLKQRGDEELALRGEITMFDGDIDLTNSYKYGIDFFLGDIVQLKDAYGHVGQKRITEIIFSEDLNGFRIYPTLKSI